MKNNMKVENSRMELQTNGGTHETMCQTKQMIWITIQNQYKKSNNEITTTEGFLVLVLPS